MPSIMITNSLRVIKEGIKILFSIYESSKWYGLSFNVETKPFPLRGLTYIVMMLIHEETLFSLLNFCL